MCRGKFHAFLSELHDLCVDHDVVIATEHDSSILVEDATPDSLAGMQCIFEDHTALDNESNPDLN